MNGLPREIVNSEGLKSARNVGHSMCHVVGTAVSCAQENQLTETKDIRGA